MKPGLNGGKRKQQRKPKLGAGTRLQTEFLEGRHLLTAVPIISEFMADNQGTLTDGHGQSPDWIEVFNAGDSTADLTGWYLTDDAAELTKWAFPATILTPGEFLVVFASGDSVPDPAGNLHTNFQLRSAGDYLALVEPDGLTIVSEFGAAGTSFPAQEQDISYGVVQNATTSQLVTSGATADLWIPSSDALGTAWTEPGFTPGVAWTEGPTPIGYDTATGGGTSTSVLKLDFNDVTDGEVGAANTEAGFSTMTLAENGTTIDGVTVTFTALGGATLDDRDRAVPTDNPPLFTQDQLYDDFIFANGTFDGAGLEILLDGLAPSTLYNLTIWSFDDSSNGQRRSNWTETSSGVPIEIQNGYTFDGNVLPDVDLDDTIQAQVISSPQGTLR